MPVFKSYRDHNAAGHPVIYTSETDITGSTKYECAFCGDTFSKALDAGKHVRRQHRRN